MQAHAERTNEFERVTTVVRRRRLVEDHSDLVQIIARQVGRCHDLGRCSLDEDDLFSVGILGLFDAELRFDASTGCPFRSFAEFRIKGAMLDEIRRRDTMPRRLQTANTRIRRAEEKISSRTGRDPTTREVAEQTGMTVERVLKIRLRAEAHRHATPLALRSDAMDPEQVVEIKERYEALAHAIERLSEREQIILDLYFRRDMTLREIADILDLTEGRICQIKKAAVATLRDLLSAH